MTLSLTLKHVLMRLCYRSDGWNFSARRQRMFIYESEDWLKHYLPIPMKGLTVLDVGAGEGETARFFLEHGAKKVLCIEPNADCFMRLRENTVGRPMECFHKKFCVDDLNLDFDFMKMDIEGYEEELLEGKRGGRVKQPCVIELHGLQLIDRFLEQGFEIKRMVGDSTSCVSYAYKNISYKKLPT